MLGVPRVADLAEERQRRRPDQGVGPVVGLSQRCTSDYLSVPNDRVGARAGVEGGANRT